MTNKHAEEPIAIVGSAVRFPGGASSPSKLWDLLSQPRDVLKEFDPERLNLKRFHHQDGEAHGATNVTNSSYLIEEDTRLFDASFFGITPKEAAGMDPQQRQLLETVYEAFESAGTTLDELRGSLTSVHVGVMTNDWANIQLRDPETLAQYTATGTANSIISNRISYIFDLKGPSVTMDTACSSSLVALHHAARGLLDGDMDTAVVAGVNLILDPGPYITESKLHMLSPESRSRMWDKAANGYARGEGTAALYLKTLSKALADGDHIEGIVRSTGVNSDGLSPGITMPFAPTQAALIRHTYKRAGLDPLKDRPQYFECHGTGTPAGDPVEARAISEAFVAAGGAVSAQNPLYVGSIKTVIGHLEGCAGLAGVMKVLLAIKHRVIPPNLLFHELNPALKPFYGPLLIPTQSVPWPALPAGEPARASVNSFGFGGTNAHAIIESYEPTTTPQLVRQPDSGALGPLIFSAGSGASLLRTVRAHLAYINANPEIDFVDLSWLLQTRRTAHRVRTHFSGPTRDAIIESMQSWVSSHESSSSANIGAQPRLVNPRELPGTLGVFTGQGAQWPAMGRYLIDRSPLFRDVIEKCEAVLNALPAGERPEWSLVKELTAEGASSRLSEAALSQPLCTAVQLGLVDLLAASGVGFDSVVGHSSGEIAAVYASGIITAEAAIQIAYYRGFHAKLARGAKGQKGGMLAAGMSFDKAKEFCARPEFVGRLSVAASNAPSTVTLSGDIDAIKEAKEILDDDSIFARALKVDTAYHSHHMKPCAEPYLKSLLACNIQITKPKQSRTQWSSSVRGDARLLKGDLSSLKGPYWVANMVQTVLFSQAVESSIWHGGPFDLAIELGPHPALKGPVEQTLKNSYGQVPPYTGALKRGSNDVEAFSDAIGAIFSQLGPKAINFAGYRAAFYEKGAAPTPRMVKGLPSYVWDHDQILWRESGLSRRYRTMNDSTNDLLGRRTPDDNERELRWRNVLRLSELPWMRGHEVLGEVLLPGAAYVSFAVEAGRQLAASVSRDIKLIEVENVDILRPVVVPDKPEGVETLFTAKLQDESALKKGEVLRADFSFYVVVDPASGAMVHAGCGQFNVHFGTSDADALPPRAAARDNLFDIDTERVYSMFKGLGLNYSGGFRTMTDSKRTLGYATATGVFPDGTLSNSIAIHPALLDVSLQTLLVARAHPASSQISIALLPSHIKSVRVSPHVPALQKAQQEAGDGTVRVDFEAWDTERAANSLTGDISLYDSVTGKTIMEVEGLILRQVGEQGPEHDRPVFAKTIFPRDVSMGLVEPERDPIQDTELLRLTENLERVALFYAKRLADETVNDDKSGWQEHHLRMLEANAEHIDLAKTGKHPMLRREWLNDTPDVLRKIDAAHSDAVQLQMLHAVGRNYTQIVRGETAQLEVMTKDDLLNRFYMEDLGCIRVNNFLAQALKQITAKYPRCNILEIGAGTGGTTWSVLNAIDDAYASYTFTDVSSAFLASSSQKFADFTNKMIFKTLDVESDPAKQGYVPHSYDVIVAANVLHATKDLKKTMEHVRSLLRPGGYCLLFETTGVQNMSIPFIFGGLPGWLCGEESERRLRPTLPPLRWDEIMQETGFSGLDMVMTDVSEESKHTTALLVSQAVTDKVMRLRKPLSEIAASPAPEDGLLLIGGKKLNTSKILTELRKLLPRGWKRQIQAVDSVDAVADANINPGTDVICLHDEDEPFFANLMTAPRLAALQGLLMKSRNLLWVTSATTGKTHAPRATMIHGVARVAPAEMPHLRIQVLGFEGGIAPAVSSRHIAEAYARLRETGEVDEEEADEGKLMWFQEPEVEVLADGEVIVPRVIQDKALNEVFIASNRTVTKRVDGSNVPVKAVAGPVRMMLQAAEADEAKNTTSSTVRTQFTLQIPAKSGEPLYLVSGTTSASTSVLAVANTNASLVIPEHVVSAQAGSATALEAAANRLLVRAIAASAEPGSKVLLYGADAAFAADVTAELALQNRSAFFASSETDAPASWIKVHAQSTKRALQRIIPAGVTLFVDCLGSSAIAGAAIKAAVPAGCETKYLDARFIEETLEFGGAALLKDAAAAAPKGTSQTYQVVEAASLQGAQVAALAPKRFVTNWQERESLTVTVPPLDTTGLFRPDRTYLMVGAAGGLGLSLCRWIVTQGAKYMAITSRNPKPDPTMLEDAARAGCKVVVFPMDVTNKESVDNVIQKVRDTMPPIAGVANAAMLLRDRLFLDMTIDQLNTTLLPKVDGSEHLDAAFANEALDWFVMLSSSATTLSNIGQANYHAANLFMASLAAKRRARGLAASAIHVGHVTDVGYIVQTKDRTASLEEHFRTIRLMPLSETDVHHAFAQAVRGGRPGSKISPDIIMGVEPSSLAIASDVAEDKESKIPWLANPRLSHLVPLATLHQAGQGQGGAAAAGSVKQQVQDAASEEDAVSIVVDAFCNKLETTLQLPEGSAKESAQRAVIDLGIDSLMAVEIRTWFLKELGAEVPVVKILSGETIIQICTAAARAVPRVAKTDGEIEALATTTTTAPAPVKEAAAPPAAAAPAPAAPTNPIKIAAAPTVEVHPDTDGNTSASENNDDAASSVAPSVAAARSASSLSLNELDPNETSSEVEGEDDVGSKKGDLSTTVSKPVVIRQERMSRAQARIWFLSKHLDDPTAYNMVWYYHVKGPINITRLRQAIQVTTQHHECLRMCFYQRVGDGHTMQGVMPASACEFNHVTSASDADVTSALDDLKTRVWDIEAGRTHAITVLSHSETEHKLIFGYHHIISDVVGVFMFLQDLDRAYRMQSLDKASAGSHLKYTAQQMKMEQSGGLDERLKFWQSEYTTLPEPLPLMPSAIVRARPTQQVKLANGKNINSVYRELSAEQAAAIRATCKKLKISPFHFYLSVLQVLLALQANIEDVCVGVVDANRGEDGVSSMIGCFVNMLPVRAQIAPDVSFSEVARGASRKALSAFAHAGLPFDMLLDAVKAPRWADGATPPLFQAAINYRSAGWGELPLGADTRMELSLDDGKDAATPYDISLGIMDLTEGCTIDLHCQASLYSAEATRGITETYVRLLEAFTVDPDVAINKVPLHDQTQISQALKLGSGPEIDFQWPATLSQRVRNISRAHANEPAVTDGSNTLTYAQLTTRVDSAVKALSTAGCTTGDRVAVLCEPSTDSVVAMLAVLQSGCVYVPLDVSLPTARHAAMVKGAQPTLLLCHAATEEAVQELSSEVGSNFSELRIDTIPNAKSTSDVPCASDANAPAVLLFTSGSTGTPKGIVLTQGNFANHIALKTQYLKLEQERVLQQSSLGFDMSMIQTFCALANGGCAVIAPRDTRRDPVALTQLLRENNVSLTIATPSEYLAWLRYGAASLKDHEGWKHACFGGEAVTKQLKRELHLLGLPQMRLTNCYGPTEITAAATFQNIDLKNFADFDEDVDDEQHQRFKYAVGKALPNYWLCILDHTGRPQPVQHTGEICIGGDGVALGYLGLTDETRKKFLTNPSGDRFYRTGDQGRILADGTLLCFGRIEGDTQIKLRGLRVELQEVETALTKASDGALSTVVVTQRGDVLVAHAIAAPEHQGAVDTAAILGQLRLPQYFIPAALIVLPSLPTNANGKLDRKAITALPLPTADGSDADGPQEKMNIHEGELRLLWERVLPASPTGSRILPSTDFFLRGGNSLLLMRLQNAIRETMGLTISTRALYRASTLSTMARLVQECRKADKEEMGDPEDINWTTESAVPSWLKQQVRETLDDVEGEEGRELKTGGIEVVLTGATGFLGGVLLEKLLKSSAVSKVHCITIPADDTHLLPANKKVKVYTGSLADNTLGLSPSEYEVLEDTADVILHAGSNGHCLNNYATLQAPNVVSTQRLAALALRRAVPILFVSSNRVALLGGKLEQAAESLAACPPPGDGQEGLTGTKWVGEVFLEKLASYYRQQSNKKSGQQRNWSFAVHRPCVVVGEQAPNSDSMNAILRYSLSMKITPLLKNAKGYIDFAPVDGVADGIIESALNLASGEETAESGRINFRHHSSNTKVTLENFCDHLQENYGGEFRSIEMREWIKLASKEGIDPLITAYLEGVLDTDAEMTFPFLGVEQKS